MGLRHLGIGALLFLLGPLARGESITGPCDADLRAPVEPEGRSVLEAPGDDLDERVLDAPRTEPPRAGSPSAGDPALAGLEAAPAAERPDGESPPVAALVLLGAGALAAVAAARKRREIALLF
jgi:hypothetical protein